jgi:hypothetical protein
LEEFQHLLFLHLLILQIQQEQWMFHLDFLEEDLLEEYFLFLLIHLYDLIHHLILLVVEDFLEIQLPRQLMLLLKKLNLRL